jgi:hypothetical protein
MLKRRGDEVHDETFECIRLAPQIDLSPSLFGCPSNLAAPLQLRYKNPVRASYSCFLPYNVD